MTWNPNIPAIIKAAAIDGLAQAAEYVIAETVPLTPMSQDGGTLRSSLEATSHEVAGGLAAVVSTSLDYAVRRHEEEAKQYTEPGTGIKYLGRGVHAAAAKVPDLIAGPIKRALKDN